MTTLGIRIILTILLAVSTLSTAVSQTQDPWLISTQQGYCGGTISVTVCGSQSQPVDWKFCKGNSIAARFTIPVTIASGSDEDTKRRDLYNQGVKVNKCSCPANIPFSAVQGSCTSVSDIQGDTIQALGMFVREYDSQVILTGGSELGHSSTGLFTHGEGFKVDLVDSYFCNDAPDCTDETTFILGLNTFIQSKFGFLGRRLGDGCLIWGMPLLFTPSPGPQLAEEGPVCINSKAEPHWDVTFPGFASSISTLIVNPNAGGGNGQISSNPRRLLCGLGATDCEIQFTRGINIDLTATADPNSIFNLWTGLTSSTDTVNGTLATVFADGTRSISATFDPLDAGGGNGGAPPLPSGSGPGAWAWDPTLNGGLGGWAWTGSTTPPKGIAPRGCGWRWDPTVGHGAWLHTICLPCRQFGFSACVSGGTLNETTVTSRDPNEKLGLHGAGAGGYLSGSQPLRYSIFFDNQPTATAPAQSVTVTDSLADSLDDLSTLTLGPISFAGRLITPPAVRLSQGGFSTNVDLRPTENLIVNVASSIDTSTGTLSWTFSSLDPVTGQPTSDPLLGLLPPGAEGSVSFTVASKAPTGVPINNKATVVFDRNAPLDTEVWLNTIDKIPPASSVQPLSATEPASGFTLTWSGTDVGSGVQDFTIFVSDNGGPFTPFQTNTNATSVTFTGEAGHTYGFYSIARDLVGNVEASKTAAEATTQVVLISDSTPPTTSVLSAPTPNAAGWNNSNVTVTLNSADDPGGTGVKQITYSAMGAQPIASTTVPAATTSFQVSNEGITTIAFFGTDNAGNVEMPKTLIVELDKTPPSIAGSRTPLPNANGWNNIDVTVSFACADTLSGLSVGSPPPPTVFSTEVTNQSVTGMCQDLAGNSSSTTVSGINVDKTPSIVTCSVSPSILWPPDDTLVSVNAYVTVTDSLSGSAGFNLVSVTSSEPDSGLGDIQGFVAGTPSVSGQLRAQRLGSGNGRVYTLTYSGLDRAGNPASCTTTVTVPHDQGH